MQLSKIPCNLKCKSLDTFICDPIATNNKNKIKKEKNWQFPIWMRVFILYGYQNKITIQRLGSKNAALVIVERLLIQLFLLLYLLISQLIRIWYSHTYKTYFKTETTKIIYPPPKLRFNSVSCFKFLDIFDTRNWTPQSVISSQLKKIQG